MGDSEDRAKRGSKHTKNVAQVDLRGRRNNGCYMDGAPGSRSAPGGGADADATTVDSAGRLA